MAICGRLSLSCIGLLVLISATFVPRKSSLIIRAKHEQNEEFQELIDASDLDVLTFDKKWGQYRFRIKETDLENDKDILLKIIADCYKYYMGITQNDE